MKISNSAVVGFLALALQLGASGTASAQPLDEEGTFDEETLEPVEEVEPEHAAPIRKAGPLEPEPPWPRKGLMIAGWATLGGGYLFSALVGLEIMQRDLEAEQNSNAFYKEECLNCDETGPYMLIPLIGPFLAMPAADGTDGKVICALMGGVQVTGLVLGIVGTSIFVSDKQRYQEWERRNSGLLRGWYVSSAVVPLGNGLEVPTFLLGTSF